ncbi:MAG: DUF92 domain-containing protein, partial [Methanobacteriota archaeon]
MPAPVPLDFVSSVLISVFLTGVLSALAYRRNVLTWDGSLAVGTKTEVLGRLVRLGRIRRERLYRARSLPAPVPLDFVSSVLISVFLTGVLSALAYRRNVLTWDGSLAAFVVGMVIGIFGDVTWLFLLLFFLLSSFLATRYRFALKEAMGVQEGIRGERRSTNVLANGVALMAVAVLSLIQPPGFPRLISGVVFLSALSVAGSDTLASEIGVLSRHTYLITNGKPVPPGTDGGVSLLGTLCALGAAVYTSVVGW